MDPLTLAAMCACGVLTLIICAAIMWTVPK